MPVNEFEKQVQQKMDELKFTPSAEVWAEVEKRIRKEKKRRFIFFWWLLPALLLGSGAVYIMNNRSTSENITLQEQQDRHNTITDASAVQPTPQKDKSTGLTDVKASGETMQQHPTESNQDASASDLSIAGNGILSRDASPKQIVIAKPAIAKKKMAKITVVKETTPEPGEKEMTASEVSKQQTKEQYLPVTATDTEQSNNPETAQVIPARSDSSVIAKEKVATVKEEPVVTNKPPHRENSQKWKLGAGMYAGASNTWWGSLFEGRQEMFDATPQSTIGSGTGVNQPVYITAPRSGLALGVELSAQKELSSKLALRLGLHYQYMNNHIKTGSRVDSTRQVFNAISDGTTVSNYYRPPGSGAEKDYTNKYHFAGLSANLSWKVIERRKFSLSWENGLALNRLLSTNALHYDRNLQAYYEDFKPFRKTQLFVSTGLSVPVIRSKGFSLSVNPFASYALTPVLKKNYSISSHHLVYGVGLKVGFSSIK